MLDTLENRIESSLDSAPFLAKIFFGHEIRAMQAGLRESRRLRETYEPTEDWYVAYAERINNCFGAAHNAVETAYNLYDAIGRVPLVGKPICSMMENYLGNAISGSMPQGFGQGQDSNAKMSFRLPQKATALNVVTSIQSAASETICAHYEMSTGNSADSLRAKIAFTPSTYKKDSGRLGSYFANALESIGSFFREAFGYSKSS